MSDAGAPPPAIVMDSVSKTFRVPEERTHTLKERALHPLRTHRHRDASRRSRTSRSRSTRRVLRDRRAQRQRQEHAAEVHRRHLRRGQRTDLVHGRAVDVHRARRRLQPGPGGARQRRHQRDHARPHAARGAGTRFDARHRVRRTRGVHRPEAQELLLRDARAPGVLDRDPGRRRHPADRRGARRRRRRLPAEVLRRVLPHARRRQDDRVRLPRHGLGQPLLPPRDAAGARRHGRARRSATRSPTATWSSTSAATGAADGGRRRRVPATARPGSSRPGSRTTPASALADVPSRASRSCCEARVASRSSVEDPAAQRVRASTSEHGRTAMVATTATEHERSGASRRARRCVFSLGFDNLLAPGRYTRWHASSRRGGGLDVIDRWSRAAARSWSTAPSRRAASSSCPVDDRRIASRARPRRLVEQPPSAVRRAPLAAEPLGRPIRGPRALSDDWSRFWPLTFTIARTEFKLRFFGSALGYVWQLMRPLLLFGVLYVFFTEIAHVNNGDGAEQRVLRRAAARLDRAVHVLRRSDDRRRAQRRRPREPRAQDPLPAPGDPALGRAARARSTSV